MSSEDKKVWGVHTQDDYLFLHKDVIAIGWKDFGDLKAIENTRDAFKEHYATVYPQSKKQAIANSAGMLYRFIYEVQAGDYIVFPSKSDRKINIGVVEGEYEYVPSAPEYVQQRKVRWIKHLPRTLFSQGALYESGSFLSLFLIKKYSDEFVAALDDNFKKDTADTEDETIGATAEDIRLYSERTQQKLKGI